MRHKDTCNRATRARGRVKKDISGGRNTVDVLNTSPQQRAGNAFPLPAYHPMFTGWVSDTSTKRLRTFPAPARPPLYRKYRIGARGRDDPDPDDGEDTEACWILLAPATSSPQGSETRGRGCGMKMERSSFPRRPARTTPTWAARGRQVPSRPLAASPADAHPDRRQVHPRTQARCDQRPAEGLEIMGWVGPRIWVVTDPIPCVIDVLGNPVGSDHTLRHTGKPGY